MKTHATVIRIAGVVALAWTAADGSGDTLSRTAVRIGVAGRANANVSMASSGSFVGVAWGGPHEGRRDRRLRGDQPRRRAIFRSPGAGEPGAR